jgi:hypothetical protein
MRLAARRKKKQSVTRRRVDLEPRRSVPSAVLGIKLRPYGDEIFLVFGRNAG